MIIFKESLAREILGLGSQSAECGFNLLRDTVIKIRPMFGSTTCLMVAFNQSWVL